MEIKLLQHGTFPSEAILSAVWTPVAVPSAVWAIAPVPPTHRCKRSGKNPTFGMMRASISIDRSSISRLGDSPGSVNPPLRTLWKKFDVWYDEGKHLNRPQFHQPIGR